MPKLSERIYKRNELQMCRSGTASPVDSSHFLSTLPNQQFSMKSGENDELDLSN